MFNVCVMASGGGGNLRSILEVSLETHAYVVNCVIVDRDCGATSVASDFGVPSYCLKDLSSTSYLNLVPISTDLLVLAGFMPIVPGEVCKAFENRFINTHPSLLPKYGGIGMHGVKVQEAVLNGGESTAGCTVHRVDSNVDTGEILEQVSIEIPKGIDAWTLGGMVFELETKLLPKVILDFANGKYKKC